MVDKIGIHSQDWEKLLAELQDKLAPAIYIIVKEILEKYSTRYL